MHGSELHGFELRVHGIGNHGPLSAIGDPQLRDSDPKTGICLYEAPEPPGHRVQMFSWTPTAHSKFNITWWAGLPFTLINVAGHMQPVGHTFLRWLHGFAVGATSLIVTAGYMLWAISAGEAALSRWGPAAASYSGELLVCFVMLTLVVIIGLHHRNQPDRRGAVKREERSAAESRKRELLSAAWAIVHIVMLLGLGAWLVQSRPADGTFDWLAAYVIGSIVFVGVLGGICLLIGLVLRKPVLNGFTGIGALLLLSIVLTNTVWALLRMTAAWLSHYLDVTFDPGPKTAGMSGDDRILTLWRGHVNSWDQLIYLVPLFSFCLLLACALGFGLVRSINSKNLKRENENRYPTELRLRKAAMRAQKMHDFVYYLDRLLPWLLVLATCYWLLMLIGWTPALLHPSINAERGMVFAVHLMTVIAAASFIAVAFLPGARARIARVGDILGYWPVVWSPLAGTSYSRDVIDALKKLIRDPERRPLVVVGHSQGSVISLDALRELRVDTDLTGVSLATCGSPFATLYAKFFPKYFPPSTFTDLSGVVEWANFWRATDPIASPMPPGSGADDIELLDVIQSVRRWPFWTTVKLRKHNGYWTESKQATWIKTRLID